MKIAIFLLYFIGVMIMNGEMEAVEFSLGGDFATPDSLVSRSKMTEENLLIASELPEGSQVKYYKIRTGCYLSVVSSINSKKILAMHMLVTPPGGMASKQDANRIDVKKFKMNKDGSFELISGKP